MISENYINQLEIVFLGKLSSSERNVFCRGGGGWRLDDMTTDQKHCFVHLKLVLTQQTHDVDPTLG